MEENMTNGVAIIVQIPPCNCMHARVETCKSVSV